MDNRAAGVQIPKHAGVPSFGGFSGDQGYAAVAAIPSAFNSTSPAARSILTRQAPTSHHGSATRTGATSS